jgi:putative ABC transport system permease protein
MNALMVLRVALKALRVNKLRSSLTMLGMIIGVAAVIAMLAIGGGAQARPRAVENLAHLMLILPGSTTASGVRLGAGAAQTLTEEDRAGARWMSRASLSPPRRYADRGRYRPETPIGRRNTSALTMIT